MRLHFTCVRLEGNRIGSTLSERAGPASPWGSGPGDEPLVRIGRWLQGGGYRFVTVTPATHGRVNSRPGTDQANSVRDIFGWSRPFRSALLPAEILALLDEAGALERASALLRSRVRFSSLGDSLYVHTAYPTAQPEAVFFGPDTYRFAALIERTLAAER